MEPSGCGFGGVGGAPVLSALAQTSGSPRGPAGSPVPPTQASSVKHLLLTRSSRCPRVPLSSRTDRLPRRSRFWSSSVLAPSLSSRRFPGRRANLPTPRPRLSQIFDGQIPRQKGTGKGQICWRSKTIKFEREQHS